MYLHYYLSQWNKLSFVIHTLLDETLRWRFIVVSLYFRSSNEAFPGHDLRRALFPSIKFVAPRTKKKKKRIRIREWVLGCEAIIYLRSCALLVRKISGNNDLSSWSIHLWNFFFFFFNATFTVARNRKREKEEREREKRKMSMAINGGSLLHRSVCSSRREIASTFVLLVTSDVNAILISVALPWNDWWQL